MNKNIPIGVVVLMLLIAGDACSTKHALQAEMSAPITASYSDGSITVEATFNTDEETVTFTCNSLGRVTLPRAVSASGARFANKDESIVFWEHQGEATIKKGGTVVFRGTQQQGGVDETNAQIPLTDPS